MERAGGAVAIGNRVGVGGSRGAGARRAVYRRDPPPRRTGRYFHANNEQHTIPGHQSAGERHRGGVGLGVVVDRLHPNAVHEHRQRTQPHLVGVRKGERRLPRSRRLRFCFQKRADRGGLLRCGTVAHKNLRARRWRNGEGQDVGREEKVDAGKCGKPVHRHVAVAQHAGGTLQTKGGLRARADKNVGHPIGIHARDNQVGQAVILHACAALIPADNVGWHGQGQRGVHRAAGDRNLQRPGLCLGQLLNLHHCAVELVLDYDRAEVAAVGQIHWLVVVKVADDGQSAARGQWATSQWVSDDTPRAGVLVGVERDRVIGVEHQQGIQPLRGGRGDGYIPRGEHLKSERPDGLRAGAEVGPGLPCGGWNRHACVAPASVRMVRRGPAVTDTSALFAFLCGHAGE